MLAAVFCTHVSSLLTSPLSNKCIEQQKDVVKGEKEGDSAGHVGGKRRGRMRRSKGWM